MVIYHATPFRYYPDLIKSIGSNFKHIYQFHEPFELINPNDYTFNDGVLNYPPEQVLPTEAYFDAPASTWAWRVGQNHDENLNGLRPKAGFTKFKIDFLFGIFNPKRIIYNNNFVFTIIEHPVTHVYNTFFYFNYLCSQRSCMSFYLKNESKPKIDEYIDLVLDNNFKIVFTHKNKQYKLIDNCFLNPPLEKFNFVGIAEELPKTIRFLNNIFKSRLNVSVKPTSSIIKNNNYRQADLERFLSKEIEYYEIALNKLKILV